MKIITIAAIAVAIMLTGMIPALAGVPDWRVTVEQVDSTWNYTVYNNTPDVTAVGLDLFWSDGTDIYDHPSVLGHPDNWTVLDPAVFFFVTVPAWSADDNSFGIAPGTHLTGFTVESDAMPDSFNIYSADSPDEVLATGSVETESPVAPEPGSLAALLSGLVAVGGAFIKRRSA